jgi:hypothetical protein
LHGGLASHPLHALANDGEPDARAGILLLLVKPLEDAEDAVVVARIDADAVVLDPELHAGAAALGPDSDRGATPGATNFAALESRWERTWTSASRWPRMSGSGSSTLTSACFEAIRSSGGGGPRRRRTQRHALQREVLAADPAVVQQPEDELVHAVRGLDDAASCSLPS